MRVAPVSRSIEAIEIESTHTIDIDSFALRSEIDQRFFDTPYYITPNEPVGQEAFAVIREAMRSKALVALGRIVLAKRERVMALEPYDRGLLGTTLHYPYEVRHANDYFADIPELTPAPELLRLAEYILDSKLQAFDPSAFRDRYGDGHEDHQNDDVDHCPAELNGIAAQVSRPSMSTSGLTHWRIHSRAPVRARR
jgi:Ku protein